jgi:hypothetical protein
MTEETRKLSRCSSHATGWQPWNRASIPRRDRRFISSPKLPYRLCCPSSFLFRAHLGLSLRGIKRPQRETEHSPHVMLQLRMNGVTPPLPLISLYCVRRETFIVYVNTNLTSYGVSKSSCRLNSCECLQPLTGR